MLAPTLNAKRLELLHEVVAQARTIAMLVNPRARNAEPNVDASKTAATALGEQLVVFNASTDEEIESAFAELSRQQISALIVGTDIFLNSRSDQSWLWRPAIRSRLSMVFGDLHWQGV